MAKVSGAAAYQQLRPIGNYISDNANAAADRGARTNAQMRALNAEKEKQKRAEQKSAFEKLELAPDSFKTTATGFDTRDDVMRDYAMSSTIDYIDWGEKGVEAYLKGDMEGYYKALSMQKKLLSNFQNMNNNEALMKEVNANFQKRLIEGWISPVDEEFEKAMQAYEDGNIRITNDENGVPRTQFLLNPDETDKPSRWTERRASNIINGNYRPYEKFFLNEQKPDGTKGWVEETSSKLGVETTESPEGLIYTRSKKNWTPEAEALLQAEITGKLSNDRVLSSVLYQATGVKRKGKEGGEEPFTEDERKIAYDHMYTLIKGTESTTDTKKTDSGAVSYVNAQQRLKFDKEKEEQVYGAHLVTDSKGEATVAGQKSSYNGSEFKVLDTKGKPMMGVIEDDSEAEIYSIIKQGESTYAKIRIPSKTSISEGVGGDLNDPLASSDGKKTTRTEETKFKVVKLTDAEATTVANKMGLINTKELHGYLEGVKRQELGKDKGKSEEGGMTDEEYQQFLKDNGLE